MNIVSWMLYTMWAIFGFMFLDLLIGLFRSIVTRSFSLNLVLDYLKDILYYVLPLTVVITMIPLDPTGWILMIFYYISGLAVILNYMNSIKNKWKA